MGYRAMDLWNYKATQPLENAAQLTTQIQRDGCTLIPNFYSEEKCETLRKEIDALIVAYKDSIWKDDKAADLRIFGAGELSEKILAFDQDELLHNIAETYQKVPIRNLLTMAARLTALPENLGSGGGWHRDTVSQRQFKAIVYLSDVTEEHGPFQYLKGSHKKSSLLQLVKKGHLKFSQNRMREDEIEMILKENDFELQTFTGKAGTLLLSDTSGIHRGKPIEKGQRYAMTNYYFPSHLINPKVVKKFNAMKVKQV